MEIKWTEAYSVNNEIIDVQHKKLIAIVNNFSYSIAENKGLEVIENVLDEMSTYAWLHFRTEEDLLFKSNYDALQQHKTLHNQFKKEIMKTTQEIMVEKTINQVIEIHRYLHKWLSEHILEEDVKYCENIK